ncbi:hypothetical protein [Roseomonas chloroacetimidivorans]|uniref:hypothetical protein n=1 Tax=Roseomonas chloroacetimidivorans TaxID=1766656 RepID=UPI003C75D657
MSSPELDGLIVEHLADLDQAAIRISGIETAIFTAMGQRAKEWAEGHGWVSDFDYPEDDGWDDWAKWVAPPDWRTADTAVENSKFDGKFELSLGDGDTGWGQAGEDWFYLTRLCRVAAGQIGLRFSRPDFVKVPRWKQAIPRIREIVTHPSFIVITASKEPALFLPFKIDAAALAAALRDEDPGAALGPFETALDTLLDTKPAFDQVLQHLRPSAG